MKIVIVGANGFIGKALTNFFSRQHQVIPLTHPELNIANEKEVQRKMLVEGPDLIINCAVLGVEACELNPALARTVNVRGAENLAQAATALDAEILHLSTNYVFDGQRVDNAPYTIEDIPTPINVYGQTKLAGEQAVSALSTKSFVIRTSWIFGVGKVNFFCQTPLWLKQAQKIRAITNMWANSTYLADFILRVSEILSVKHYGLYQVVNSGLCSYYEFALEAAKILRIAESQIFRLIEPIKQADLEQKAIRPASTPMRCLISEQIGLAPMREWRVALAEYIDKDCP